MNWRVEQDPTSLAAMDLPAIPSGTSTPAGANEAGLRFGLSGGPAAGQYAALVVDLANGLAPSDRVAFAVRAEQPMRVSVQLRSTNGRWQRSIYVDKVSQKRTVYFDDLTPASLTDTDKPQLSEIRNILFVVDSTNTKPGTSGRIWITAPALER